MMDYRVKELVEAAKEYADLSIALIRAVKDRNIRGLRRIEDPFVNISRRLDRAIAALEAPPSSGDRMRVEHVAEDDR